MDIVELRLQVAKYLSRAELLVCSLVCKEWHTTFHECLWADFELRLPDSVVNSACTYPVCWTHVRCIRKHFVAKNAHRIRRLVLPNQWQFNHAREYYTLFAKQCTQLRSVSFYDTKNVRYILKDLFAANTGIQYFSTNASECLVHIAILPHLRVLNLDFTIDASEALQILEDCPHLEDFSPTRIIGPVPGESFQEDSLSEPASKTLHFRLKKLSLRLTSIDDALEVILARCPRLEHLQFHRLMTPTSAAVARALLRKRVRCLSSIDVSLERNSSVTHTVLKALSRNPIQSMTVHTPLYSTYQAIGQLYGQRLKHIFLHLDSTSVEGLVHIFNQCQSLKTLEATMNHQIWYIDLRYVIGLPWVCHQLESLTIPFSLLRRCSNDSLLQVARAEKAELGPANKMPEWLRAENIFMKRLAGLSKLRRLHLNTTGGQIPVYGRNHRKCMAKVRSDMSWCLEGGLEQLVGLVNLESLCLGYQRYLQGEEELSWMKTNWPNLLKLVVYQLENSHRRWINHHWPELTVVELASEND